MSNPTEPLKLTLEEILVAIEREAYGVLTPIPARGRSTAHSWVYTDLTDQSSPKNAHDFESLSAAASFALDRPVVARDDAAELRAALEGIEELLSKPNTDSLGGVARRLGAVAIARAALAATEGEA